MSSRPVSASALSGENAAHFDSLVEKALLRKRLFKEYITRHQVLERFNTAIEALFDQPTLPEDPFAFINDHVARQVYGEEQQ